MGRLVIVIGLVMLCPLLFAQQELNNDSVVKLMKAGVSEDLIITTINRSRGSYDTSVDGLIAMKTAGMSNPEISAIVARASAGPVAAVSAPPSKPRVLLRSQNHASGWSESRDQSMEMSKDFQDVCPDVRISLNQTLMDYTVQLNHIEHGFVRDNQMQVANRQGDVISRIKEGASIKAKVKKACDVITADWAKQ